MCDNHLQLSDFLATKKKKIIIIIPRKSLQLKPLVSLFHVAATTFGVK